MIARLVLVDKKGFQKTVEVQPKYAEPWEHYSSHPSYGISFSTFPKEYNMHYYEPVDMSKGFTLDQNAVVTAHYLTFRRDNWVPGYEGQAMFYKEV